MKHLGVSFLTSLFISVLASGSAHAAKSGSVNHKDGALAAAAYHQSKKEALLVELTGKDIKRQSDVELYAELIEAHHNDDEIGFKSRLQNILSLHKQSAFADNALYLAAQRAMDQKDFAGAIRFLGKIEKNYPRSNKLVSAKFLKAQCYKAMNLLSQAKQAYVDVRVRFPGSPESFRAATELKILSAN